MREVNHTKRKRWVSLYVENRIGVLARISGMMSGKSYNSDRRSDYFQNDHRSEFR